MGRSLASMPPRHSCFPCTSWVYGVFPSTLPNACPELKIYRDTTAVNESRYPLGYDGTVTSCRDSSPPINQDVAQPMNQALADTAFLDQIAWNADGLVPAIAQDADSGRVLMLAWMNREALELSAREGRAVYWSRSRQALWRKGESSGHVQQLRDIRLDCDADALVLLVKQEGGIACHTGRESCFYRHLADGQWHTTDPVLKDPDEIY